jgi:hypothetical protein
MYIFIREDLTHEQQIVQASHAALEAGFQFSAPKETTHIVLIGAKDEDKLKQIQLHLIDNGIEHEIFFEPDFDTGFTAIATRPLFGDERIPLKKFKLYKRK